MQQRSFPRIPGLAVSTLGFGAMRLPTVDGDRGRIDEERALPLVRAAVEAGVTYFDTAWVYHGGQSEAFLGRALRGLRSGVQLATKCPVWEVASAADAERVLGEQLRRLETDRIDFYLLHALDGGRWDRFRASGALAALVAARREGRVGHLGFSFHGPPGDFARILGEHDWEFTQIQFNYLDQGFQAGLEGLRVAAARGVGVIVMEPLRGGALALAPAPVRQVLARTGRPWSPAEWALRWVWHHPEVVTVLSGMGTLEQLSENVAAAHAAAPLGEEELALVEEARAFYAARMAVPCTSCGYCQPCPQGVAIADTFNAWNSARMFEVRGPAAWSYKTFVLGPGAGADRCAACGDCEPRCPQHIAIPEGLEAAHAFLCGE